MAGSSWTDEHVPIAFTRFYEMIFGKTITDGDRSAITDELVQGVTAGDRSIEELLTWVMKAYAVILSTPGQKRDGLLEAARERVLKHFSQHDASRRGALLAKVQKALFQPGSVSYRPERPAPTPTPGGPGPLPVPVSHAHPSPPHSPAPAAYPDPLTAIGGLGTPDNADLMDLQRRERTRAQLDLLRSQIESMRHDVTMNIIRNIR